MPQYNQVLELAETLTAEEKTALEKKWARSKCGWRWARLLESVKEFYRIGTLVNRMNKTKEGWAIFATGFANGQGHNPFDSVMFAVYVIITEQYFKD